MPITNHPPLVNSHSASLGRSNNQTQNWGLNTHRRGVENRNTSGPLYQESRKSGEKGMLSRTLNFDFLWRYVSALEDIISVCQKRMISPNRLGLFEMHCGMHRWTSLFQFVEKGYGRLAPLAANTVRIHPCPLCRDVSARNLYINISSDEPWHLSTRISTFTKL